MSESSDVTQAWQEIQGRLPSGWALDGLRCTSTGLAPSERGAGWRALATGPGGAAVEGVGDEPISALQDVARKLASSSQPG